MPDLRPFRGIRYSSLAGEPADLVAPPYDVITPEEHVALCRRSPCNIVRLDLGERRSAGAPPSPDWYSQAATSLASWQHDGLLATDPEAAFYLYSQEFDHDGQRRRRKLLLGALRLEPYETGRILPHENTLPGPKADRLRLMQACHANLSPILAFFPDPEGSVNQLLESMSAAQPALAFEDGTGIRHELRCAWDTPARRRLSDALAPLPLYIADGHHRYETALVYQQLCRSASPGDRRELPCDFVLAACMSSADPGLVIRPTHRIVRWDAAPGFGELFEAARRWFDVEPLPFLDTESALAALGTRRARPSFIAYGGDRKRFYFIDLQDDEAMQESPYPPRSPLRLLPAAVFSHGFVARLLGERKPVVGYTADAAAAVRSVDAGTERLAALLPSVRPAELMAVVNGGERMPPKSTYFWPKPLTGIVLRSLDEF